MSTWFPAADLAREYNKDRKTIIRWIKIGFLATMGYDAHCDPMGRWFVRKKFPLGKDGNGH
jgi:hypothetical protein